MTREELIRIQLQNKIRVMEVNQRVEISSEIEQRFIDLISDDLYRHKSCRYLMTIWHDDYENLRGNYQAIACKTSTNRFGNYKGNYKLVGVKLIDVEDELRVFKDNIILFEQTMFRDINIDKVLE